MCFKEVDCVCWSVALERNRDMFEALSVSELVGFLSMFAYDKVDDDTVITLPPNVISLINVFETLGVECNREKLRYFEDWCNATNDTQCKQIIVDSGLYAGEFIKIVLKINNICSELTAACSVFGYTRLAKKISEVAGATLKSIVTTQSLYL